MGIFWKRWSRRRLRKWRKILSRRFLSLWQQKVLHPIIQRKGWCRGSWESGENPFSPHKVFLLHFFYFTPYSKFESGITRERLWNTCDEHARKLLFSITQLHNHRACVPCGTHRYRLPSTTPTTPSVKEYPSSFVPTPLTVVFWPLWEKIRAFYYLSREIFHLWTDRQRNECRIISKTDS